MGQTRWWSKRNNKGFSLKHGSQINEINLHTSAYLHTGSYNSEVHLSCVSFLNSFCSYYCKISVFFFLLHDSAAQMEETAADNKVKEFHRCPYLTVTDSYIVMVIGFCGTLSFGFIFYYHYYVFSLTFILFCFSSFFLTCCPNFSSLCLILLYLHFGPPAVLFIWVLFSVSLCVSVQLILVYFHQSYFGGSRSFCFSSVIVLHAFNCVKLLSQLRSAPVSHSPSALIVTNTVYGPLCPLQKEVLVIHRWFLCLFLLMLFSFFTGSACIPHLGPHLYIPHTCCDLHLV